MVESLARTVHGLEKLVTLLLLVFVCSSPVLGEGFRVENQVFSEDEEEPISKSTTIFHEDLVYDYLESPKEITVFDRTSGRIILLDPVKKIRTELTTRNLETLAQKLRNWAGGQGDEFLRFSSQPAFEEDYDNSTGGLRLQSPWISYQVETTPPSRREILELYLEFCDWYALLNARLDPGSRPPFPRMQLNRVLAEQGRMPQEVQLTVRPKGDTFLAEEISARSQHHVVPHLLESDRTRIAQTDQFMAMFRPLPFNEYQAHVQPSR